MDLGTLRQMDHGTRRVGRPRVTWYQTTIADMWEEVKRTDMGMSYAGEMDLGRQSHVDAIRVLCARYNDRHAYAEERG